jgi:hypothetical protein
MRRRANASGIRLTESDAEIAKGMILRGDRLHDIAAFFGVNSARIAEIECGRAYSWVEPASTSDLPPPGPYPARRDLQQLRQTMDTVVNLLAQLESRLPSLR